MHHLVTHAGAQQGILKKLRAGVQLSGFHSGGFWPGVGGCWQNVSAASCPVRGLGGGRQEGEGEGNL